MIVTIYLCVHLQSEGYVARSAFKLLEIQQKHKLIQQGNHVLDLGCHPGAWMQVACQSLGPKKKGGLVVGVDIQQTSVPQRYCDERVKIIHGDAREVDQETWRSLSPRGFDVVLSDMCHFTHGNVVADAYKSLELAKTACDIATRPHTECDKQLSTDRASDEDVIEALLKPGGHLVMKILQGPGTEEFAKELRGYFEKVSHHRPKATRSESKEVFLIGLRRRKQYTV